MKPESCYWDEHRTRLIGTRLQKIREYLREKLICTIIKDENGKVTHEEKPGIYYLRPTKGRKQIHTIDVNKKICTCQHGALYSGGKEKDPCSHWDALMIYFERQENGDELYEQF